jgi:hypothetical protein
MAELSRRHFLRAGAVSATVSLSGWLNRLAAATADSPQRKRSCILLWMGGGPSTIDLFDLKPGHVNGGPYREIRTTSPSLRIGEHLPNLAKHGDRLAVIRSMSTREGDHERATYNLRTGNTPLGGIQFPTFGSLISKETGDPQSELPNFVSIAPQRFFNQDAYSSGYLGPQYAPLIVADGGFGGERGGLDQLLKVANLARPESVAKEHSDARLELLRQTHQDFSAGRPGSVSSSHATAYDRAGRLMLSNASRAFELGEEAPALRDRYGRTLFGQGCLLARRLVERDVPFVEVNLSGWDTHQENFDAVKRLCGNLDRAWAALMSDLKDRGLLDDTLIIWMGEFGRTPKINTARGRDHFPAAWSAVLGGGGIKGGQAYGETSPDGNKVISKPTSTIDLLATVCKALGVDPEKQNMSNVGRPIRIVDQAASPIAEVLQ